MTPTLAPPERRLHDDRKKETAERLNESAKAIPFFRIASALLKR
jgi:hypothetical protein